MKFFARFSALRSIFALFRRLDYLQLTSTSSAVRTLPLAVMSQQRTREMRRKCVESNAEQKKIRRNSPESVTASRTQPPNPPEFVTAFNQNCGDFHPNL